jgi:hypothetical protein
VAAAAAAAMADRILAPQGSFQLPSQVSRKDSTKYRVQRKNEFACCGGVVANLVILIKVRIENRFSDLSFHLGIASLLQIPQSLQLQTPNFAAVEG